MSKFKRFLDMIKEESTTAKSLHFHFNKKVPSSNALWAWIERQEHITIEDFKVKDSDITIYIHGYSPSSGKQGLADFSEDFCSKFNAAAGKSKE